MFLCRTLHRVYAIKNARWRKLVIKILKHLEKRETHALYLRQIFNDYHNIEIGMYSYGCFNLDCVPENTTIGRYCSFAAKYWILNGNHPLENKSLHPFFYNPNLGYVDKLLIERTKLKIGNDVWVGHGAIITPAVNKIENGAVIGAGAVVTKNVPAYAVVAGNPARVIKYRFDDEQRREIERSAWWLQDIENIVKEQREYISFLRSLK